MKRDPRDKGRFQYWIEVEYSTDWERFSRRRRGPHPFPWLARVRWPEALGAAAIAECPLVAIYRSLRMHRAWKLRLKKLSPSYGTLWEDAA